MDSLRPQRPRRWLGTPATEAMSYRDDGVATSTAHLEQAGSTMRPLAIERRPN